MLAVALQSGYNIHDLQAQDPLVSIVHDLSIPGPVLFVHGGVTLLGTTRKGEICLWGSADGERLQVMKQSSTFPHLMALSFTDEGKASDNWRHLAVRPFQTAVFKIPPTIVYY